MTADLMLERVRRYFAAPEFVVMSEVADATGQYIRRRADAIAVSTYPSNGLEIVGIEIKITRNDWLRELRDPGKADQIRRYCDRWYLVTPLREIVKPGELPEGWGHLVNAQTSRALRAVVKAPRLSGLPIDRLFLASLIRSAYSSGQRDAQIFLDDQSVAFTTVV
jgi:hypothetical protein